MGVRFYIPLPGPFAYVPGKKHPKPKGDSESTTAAAGNIFTRVIIDRAQTVYDNAHDYAVSKQLDDPEFFAASTLNQVKLNWKITHGFGLFLTLVFWFTQMGFGTLVIALVPLLNIVAVGIPAVLIGAAISAHLHYGDKVHRDIAKRLGHQVTGRHRD